MGPILKIENPMPVLLTTLNYMLAVIDQIELPDDDPSGEGDDVLDELQLTFRALG